MNYEIDDDLKQKTIELLRKLSEDEVVTALGGMSLRIQELESQPTIADFLAQQKPMLDKTKSKMVSVASLEKFMRGE